MTTHKLMDEIVSYCTKCKLELNQRVIRVEAGKPKRVLCLTCNTERAYRKSAPAKVGEKKAPKKRPASAKVTQEAEWLERLSQPQKGAKTYDMNTVYRLDDTVEHHLFGAGLVVGLIPPDKISVFFQDGVKTMKCGRMA